MDEAQYELLHKFTGSNNPPTQIAKGSLQAIKDRLQNIRSALIENGREVEDLIEGQYIRSEHDGITETYIVNLINVTNMGGFKTAKSPPPVLNRSGASYLWAVFGENWGNGLSTDPPKPSDEEKDNL